jgi:hypothetical protein
MHRNGLSVCVVLALVGSASAQEKFTVKPRNDQQGDITNIVREEKAEESIRLLSPDGKEVQKKSQTSTLSTSFREEILAKVAGERATKLTRTYTKAELKIGENSEDLAYKGKTVLIEKSGAAYKFSVEGKALEGRDQGTLPKDFDAKKPSEEESEKLFLPNKPVAEGETWTIDAKELLIRMAGNKEEAQKTFDVEKAKASGTLTKAYKKGTAQFGVIEFNVSVPMKLFSGRFPCKDGATLSIKITGDLCIDGSISGGQSKTVTTVKGTADILKEDKPSGAVLEFNVVSTTTSTGTPVTK